MIKNKHKGNGVIHIWLPNPQAPLRVWQPTTQSWQTADNWQEVATLASLQSGTKFVSKTKQVCLYFPSINLLKITPNLPANQLKALGEAGRRYLFEDSSIGSVEDLQVKIDTAPRPSLYAIHQSDREQWEHAIALAGLELAVLLPDFVLLPTERLRDKLDKNDLGDTAINALYYQDMATQLVSYVLPTASLIATPKPALLKDNKKQTKVLRTLMTYGEAVAYLPLWLSQFSSAKHEQDTALAIQHCFIYNISENAPTPVLLAQLMPQHPLTNFHEVSTDPAFAPRAVLEPSRNFYNFAVKKSETKIPRYVHTIAAMLLAAWLVNLALDGLRWYYYQKAAAQTQTAIATQYNQWFPNERMNPRLTLERQLQDKLHTNSTPDDGVLPVISTLQTTLQQYQITAKSLNYQAKNLQLDVTAKDGETLNKAVAQLTAQGINAKLGNVANSAGMAMGQLQIAL